MTRTGSGRALRALVADDLLDVLSARPRLVFSRSQLVRRVWGEDWFGAASSVTTPRTRATC